MKEGLPAWAMTALPMAAGRSASPTVVSRMRTHLSAYAVHACQASSFNLVRTTAVQEHNIPQYAGLQCCVLESYMMPHLLRDPLAFKHLRCLQEQGKFAILVLTD